MAFYYLLSPVYKLMGLPGIGAFSFLCAIGSGAIIIGDMMLSAAELRSAKKYIYFDAMTGVKNRYVWEPELHRLTESEIPRTLTIFILDINGLKTANDRHGHTVGDAIAIDRRG